MFRTLASLFFPPPSPPAPPPPAGADTLFATHPIQLSRWLEEIWHNGGITNWPLPTPTGIRVPLGDPNVVRRLELPGGLLAGTLESGLHPPGTGTPGDPAIFAPNNPPASPTLGISSALPWDHLIYAYLVESTGIVEILGEVVRRYAVGETLDAPSVQTLAWARTTEELFFRDPPLFHIGGLTSQLRPNARFNRWNAYWRMFGWDLPQAITDSPDGQRWKQDAGGTANTRFLELWTELLGQVWLGIENENNQVGANPTDTNYIAYLCQTLGEMLRLRRRGGMLAREEFAYVTMLSWFHLTVEFDTAVVRDLRATAGPTGNPADRLAAIASRVGITSPRPAREMYELADLLSPLLWFIELDQFSTPASAQLLFRLTGVANPVIAQDMGRIIDLWQSATGQGVKDLAIRVRQSPTAGLPTRPTPQPTRLPSAALPVSAGQAGLRNGSGPATRR
jgi:hypothetical protein